MMFGAGAAAAASTLATLTVSAFGPWSTWSVSPAARPVTLASRTAVAPGAAAALSVEAAVPHVATGPLVSISSAIVE